jgi:hypothetical protein
VILSYLVRVLPDPEQKERLERVYEALAPEISHAFPDSVVRLSIVGDKLVLSGQAKDIADATQILRVVRSDAPGRAERIPVGNLNVNLNVLPDAGEDRLPEQGLDDFLLAGGRTSSTDCASPASTKCCCASLWRRSTASPSATLLEIPPGDPRATFSASRCRIESCVQNGW